MQRERVKRLNDPIWIKVPGDVLEVQIVPSAGAATGTLLFDPLNEIAIKRICRDLFVDFRGYFEADKTPVPNTLAARVELYAVRDVRAAIAQAVEDAQGEVASGNAIGDSD